MKARYLLICICIVLLGMTLACNLSDTAIESAIAQTETARPRPTNTPIPTNTPVHQISLRAAIASVDDINTFGDEYVRGTNELTPGDMAVSCVIDCAGRSYGLLGAADLSVLQIHLNEETSAEAAADMVTSDLTRVSDQGGTVLSITEAKDLVSGYGINEFIPDNTWIAQINSSDFEAAASYGSVLIRIHIFNVDEWDSATAGAILTYVMAIQGRNLKAE